MTNAEIRYYMKRFALTRAEATEIVPDVLRALEDWRRSNGWPHEQSPLTRGRLLDLIVQYRRGDL